MIAKISHIFTREFQYAEKINLFRKVLYLFLILNALTLLPIANDLFGYYGIVGSGGWNTSIPWYKQGSNGLLNLLSHPVNANRPWIAYFFIGGQLIALITGFLSIFPRLSAIAIYFFTANLFYKGYAAFTGGEVLIVIMLFYLIFINENSKAENNTSYFFQNLLNNTFYWIMLIQVCFVYFFSTWYKLIDPNWISGAALNYIAQIDHFSSAGMRLMFEKNTFVSAIGVYITLAYQALFPILVWVKRLKIPFLIVGVLLHIGIAFGMGLFAFGLTMILMYLLFLDNEQIQKIKQYLPFVKRFNQ